MSQNMLFFFTAGSTNLLKYRALYEFVARNSDELSFQPGDVIMVSFINCRCSVKRVMCGAGLQYSWCLSCPAVKAFHLQDTVASFLVYMQQISLDMGICLFVSFLVGER